MKGGQDMAKLPMAKTYAQEGRAMGNTNFLAKFVRQDFWKIRWGVLQSITFFADKISSITEWYSKYLTKSINENRGTKLTLDGSPQGRTAWSNSSPYSTSSEGESADYLAISAIPNWMLIVTAFMEKSDSKQLANNYYAFAECEHGDGSNESER